MTKILLPTLLVLLIVLSSCNENNIVDPNSDYSGKIEVIINDIPFQTDQYFRIPYTLKMWEYEKDGLVMEQILILDYNSKAELMRIDKADIPHIYKSPLPQNPYITFDNISDCYLSIQLPIPLGIPEPSKISHCFTFRDTLANKNVVIDGAIFTPRLNEAPLAISSPVKGRNWLFTNQSTMDYHFYVLFFLDGKIICGERFAFDNTKLNDDFTAYFEGDPLSNDSYFNYKDTLYAVADGTVLTIKDGLPENNGNAGDVTFNNLDEIAGNYIILDIGGGRYASYAHCVPYSFMVNIGETVNEGDPIALLGNSGNSTGPHLHFQISDGTHLLFSNGLPFVLKSYKKIGEWGVGPITPVQVTNSMMEQTVVLSFE